MVRRQVVITGGFGFLGQELAKALLQRGTLGGDELSKVVIVDVVDPSPRPAWCSDKRVDIRIGSPEATEFCDALMDSGKDACSVFHLAGIMSGQGEQDFDLCLTVNLDTTRNLLQAARKSREGRDDKVRVVFSSTAAVFGETDERPVSDTTKLVPLNTYGMTKACCELLINDFTRKGFVDGRAARLPTVVVRPGKPNAASTSCYSGVVREPLHGVDCELPVERDLPHSVSSTRAIVGGLQALHDAAWPEGLVDRVVNLPSIPITLQDLIDALHRIVPAAEHCKLGKITDKIDPFLNKVVSGMAAASMSHDRALKLGLPEPPTIDAIIREFLVDFGENCVVKAGPEVESSQRILAKTPGKRVAVITGGGTGVGKACAKALATKGGFTAIVLVGRRKEKLHDAAKEVLASASDVCTLCLACDVTKEAEVNRLFKQIEAEFGRIDLLFNNAGSNAPPVAMDELPMEAYQQVINTNITGVFTCTRAAFALMKRQEPRGGRIINNGSISADRPRPFSAPYTASKHAVTGLTKVTALDGRAHDIACGQINIGNALTEMSAGNSKGTLQADGTLLAEPSFDVVHVGEAVATMAALPPSANVLEMTIMATKAPLVGRG